MDRFLVVFRYISEKLKEGKMCAWYLSTFQIVISQKIQAFLFGFQHCVLLNNEFYFMVKHFPLNVSGGIWQKIEQKHVVSFLSTDSQN